MKTRFFVCAVALIAGISCVATFDAQAERATPSRHRNASKAAQASASKPQDAPFAFRGIPLGITLDAFRTHQAARATPVDSVPVCETDDVAATLGMRMKSDLSVTVACRWAHRAGESWQLSRAVVDGSPAQDHVLRFARTGPDASFRLYEISFVVDDVTANDLRNALANRYGAPRVPAAAASASGSTGGTVPVYVWENSVSSITLCFLPATRNGTLTYLLKDPDAWVKSVARQWLVSNPDAG
jgi:hypothetical protein